MKVGERGHGGLRWGNSSFRDFSHIPSRIVCGKFHGIIAQRLPPGSRVRGHLVLPLHSARASTHLKTRLGDMLSLARQDKLFSFRWNERAELSAYFFAPASSEAILPSRIWMMR